MTARTMPPITGPNQVLLTRLQENEMVRLNDVLYADNHFYPVSLFDIPAHEFDVPVYRITEINNSENKQTPAIAAENAA